MLTVGQWVVYGAHGVGRITAIEPEASMANTMFYVVRFERDKLVVKIPVRRTENLRPLSKKITLKRALKELVHRRVKPRTYWHLREAGYKAQLHSGNITTLAELTRNLYITDSEQQSFSEREIYDEALLRLTDEVSMVTGWSHVDTAALIEEALATKRLPKEIETLG